MIEHIEDDVAFIRQIRDFLEPGGFFYLTVPTFDLLWSNEDEDVGHFRRYTQKGIEKVVEKAGLEIVYSTYFFSILPLPIFFARSLPSRLGIHKNSNEVRKYKKEHWVNGSVKKTMNKVWKWELNKISKCKRIPFGGSCLIAAQKK